MVWCLYILLLLGCLIGLALVVITMPGLWLIAALGAAYALATHLHYLGGGTLIALACMALSGELLEIAVMGLEARRSGGRPRATLGAFIGGIAGGIVGSFIPIPIIGTILGLCLGCFLGAAVVEFSGGSSAGKSVKVGVGAARGRAFGVGAKFILGCVMLLLILWAAFP